MKLKLRPVLATVVSSGVMLGAPLAIANPCAPRDRMQIAANPCAAKKNPCAAKKIGRAHV